MDQVRAPWTQDQVDSLNGFQRCRRFHPFTGRERPEGRLDLVATRAGWEEPDEPGTVVQDWAHAFMADWSWDVSGGPA